MTAQVSMMLARIVPARRVGEFSSLTQSAQR
jgi:hypothetical protein